MTQSQIESLVGRLQSQHLNATNRCSLWAELLAALRESAFLNQSAVSGLIKSWSIDLSIHVQKRNEDLVNAALVVLTFCLHENGIVSIFSVINLQIMLVFLIDSIKNGGAETIKLATLGLAYHRIPFPQLVHEHGSEMMLVILKSLQYPAATKYGMNALESLFAVCPKIILSTSGWFRPLFDLLFSPTVEIRKHADAVLNSIAPQLQGNDLGMKVQFDLTFGKQYQFLCRCT